MNEENEIKIKNLEIDFCKEFRLELGISLVNLVTIASEVATVEESLLLQKLQELRLKNLDLHNELPQIKGVDNMHLGKYEYRVLWRNSTVKRTVISAVERIQVEQIINDVEDVFYKEFKNRELQIGITMDFEKRKRELNIGFDYSEKNIEIIKNLNERIFNYYHIVYEELLRLYENLISLKGISTDTVCIEAEVWCLYDKLPDLSEENTETIMEKSWSHNLLFSRKRPIIDFNEMMLEDGKSWNEYPFNRSEFKNMNIHYPLHVLCNHGLLSLQDLVQLKTNKLTHQFKIVMENGLI